MSLMAGVSGIRGIIGSTMTPQLAASAGCAMATFTRGGRVVVGRDSRTSGVMVRNAVISGLLAGGCEVIDLGITTTPGTAVMVRVLEAAGGVVLTASHNPVEWNGIKFLTAEGSAPPPNLADKILSIVRSGSFRLAECAGIGTVASDGSANDRHADLVAGVVTADAIRRRRFRVVLDSVNGAGGPAGRKLLELLGCQVVHVNAEPTGLFAHPPEPIEENLRDLCRRTAAEGADVGFAQDPDADRLAMVDDAGRYIGEEYSLALAARQVFATCSGPACANLSTSRMIDDLAALAGGDRVVHRSAVGEANVVELMKQHNCVIGGEGNGGVIDPRVVHVRDSLSAMALTLQLMTDEGRPLSRIVASLPRYAMVKVKIPSERSRIAQALSGVREHFKTEKMSTLDGIRVDWQEGWVHVRASNTEPVMRIIAEAATPAVADELILRVRGVVDSAG